MRNGAGTGTYAAVCMYVYTARLGGATCDSREEEREREREEERSGARKSSRSAGVDCFCKEQPYVLILGM
jgi:hypothetical protein